MSDTPGDTADRGVVNSRTTLIKTRVDINATPSCVVNSNQSGVSEEALREFSMMFKHFDKDKSGKLNHQEFRSCLRALGYDLPMVEEGQKDPEFEVILDSVDPNRSVTTVLITCNCVYAASISGLYFGWLI